MKLLYPILLWGGSLFAQTPHFLAPLQADVATACPGQTLHFKTRVAHAHRAYVLRKMDTWDTLRLLNLTPEAQDLNFELQADSLPMNVRILLVSSEGETLGEPHQVNSSTLRFTHHPKDTYQCNGGTARLFAEAPGALVYRWEIYAEDRFLPLNETSKFKEVSSPTLRVTGLVNAHHGARFRLRAEDAFGCEASSEEALLHVHQLSTAVSPTTATPFCEGDSARFYPLIVGPHALSYQWFQRRKESGVWTALTDTTRYTGIREAGLLVHGITPSETSFRLKVGFPALQYPQGQLDSSLCYMESTRINYTVHPRPAPPPAPDTLQHCGPGKIRLQAAQNVSWYTSTIAESFLDGIAHFSPDTLKKDSTFYIATRSKEACTSERKPFAVRILERPHLELPPSPAQCAHEPFLQAQAFTANGHPLFLTLHYAGGETASIPVKDTLKIPLHSSPSFRYYTSNAHCNSDTLSHHVPQLFPPQIRSPFEERQHCQGDSLTLQVEVENADKIQWTTLFNVLGEGPVWNGKIDSSTTVQVRASNACGTVEKDRIQLRISPPILIQKYPTHQTVCPETSALFQVEATGAQEFQWYLNGAPVGENLPEVLLSEPGEVYCIVKNAGCSLRTPPVHLKFHARPAPLRLPPLYLVCDSLPSRYTWLGADSLPTAIASEVRYAVQKDSLGCSSFPQALRAEIQPSFEIMAVGSTERLCSAGQFNRNASIAVLSSVPAKYTLYSEGTLLDSALLGRFEIGRPGRYTVKAAYGACEASALLTFAAAGTALEKPDIRLDTAVCSGERLSLTLQNEHLYWWEEGQLIQRGASFTSPPIAQTRNFEVSTGIEEEGLFCESPRSSLKISPKKVPFPTLELLSNSCGTGARYISPMAAHIFQDSVRLQQLHFQPGLHKLQYRAPGGCAVDTLVQVPEPEQPLIHVQPQTQQVCEGNLTQFIVQAEGQIQWQSLSPSGFENLEQETGERLRITPTLASFHENKYRAAISNGHCTVYSDTVEIQVNQVRGSPKTVQHCAGENLTLALPEVIGEIESLQWFYRAGSSGTFHLLEDTALLQRQEGYYRPKVVFSSGCSISGPSTRLLFEPRPEILAPTHFCAGDTVQLSVKNCNGPLIWSDGNTERSRSYTGVSGDSLTVMCSASACTPASLPLTVSPSLNKALIKVEKNGLCIGDSLRVWVENCPAAVLWSDGFRGSRREMTLQSKLSLNARCEEDSCSWSETLVRIPHRLPDPGRLTAEGKEVCVGYNPGSLQNTPASGHYSYRWQKLDRTDLWQDIADATEEAYNPPALSESTAFRRVALGTCGAANSNAVQFTVAPEPWVSLDVAKATFCPEEEIELLPNTGGGSGTCTLIFEIFQNGVWVTAHEGERWKFKAPQADSLFRLRVKYLCSGSSCNQAVSASREIRVQAAGKYESLTVCAGTAVTLPSCSAESTAFWVADRDSTFVVHCPSACGIVQNQLSVQVRDLPSPPINTTAYYQGSEVQLEVQGTPLLWYTSPGGSTGETSPPSPSEEGKYTYYVSRKGALCESERVPVSFEIVLPLKWESALEKLVVCEGKSAVYSLPISRATRFLWERKRPEDSNFTSFSTEKVLRFTRAGDEESPAGTLFRCTVSNGQETWAPILIPYSINSYTGKLATQKLCRGDSLRLSLAGSTTGNVLRYLWQTRAGTGRAWIDLKWPSLPVQVHAVPDSLNEAQYRCVIYYEGGCSISTDLMTLHQGDRPAQPEDHYLSFCQNTSIGKWSIPLPEGQRVRWLTAIPDIDTDVVQTYSLPFVSENEIGCQSSPARLHVEIKSLPGLPFNTTPAWSTDSLQFSAEGQALRWYSSRSEKQGLTYPPSVRTPGKKTFYVTQTIGCESPRLQIDAEIVPGLRISTQPRPQANCEGNTATFSIRASGPGPLQYQWQVQSSDGFIDLATETSRDLRISPVKDSLVLRCQVQSGDQVRYSDEVTLGVYKILAAPAQLRLCTRDSLSARLLAIQGQVQNLEWQVLNGSQFQRLDTLPTRPGLYRARVAFPNGCIRYSSTVALEILPEPEFSSFPIACPESTWGAYRSTLPFAVLEDVADSTVLHSLSGRNFTARSAEGCTRTLPPFHPVYRSVLPETGKTMPIFSLLPEPMYLQREGEWTRETRILDTLEKRYAVKDTFGCYSHPGVLKVRPTPAFLPGEIDSTFNLAKNSAFFRGNYYYFSYEGRVFLRSDTPLPAGNLQTLGSFDLPYAPQRTLHLPTVPSPVTLQWYFSKRELQAKSRYRLFGTAEGGYWEMLLRGSFHEAEDSAYVYSTFTHAAERKYRLLLGPAPRGELELLSRSPLTLKTEHLEREGEYILERREESGQFEKWRSVPHGTPFVIDLSPRTPKSVYRLVHVQNTVYRTVLDSVEVEVPRLLCEIKGNVLAPGGSTHLEMKGAKEILLFSAEGKKNPVHWQMNGNDSYEIRLSADLQPGIYFLVALQSPDQKCLKKLWIK